MPQIDSVLLVDDDDEVRSIGELCLGRMWTVHVAASGRAALALTEREHPSVALIDLCMPGMDGVALLRAFRDRPATVHLPVIFLSAGIQPEEVDHYRALGALGVISKPFRPLELPALVLRLVQRADA